MLLNTVNKSIVIKLGGAVVSNELPVVTFWADHTTTTLTPGSTDTLTNGAAAVTIVAAPAVSTQRQVKTISVYNADTISATVTICFRNVGTDSNVFKATIAPGECIYYIEGYGWKVLDIYGIQKIGGVVVRLSPMVKAPVVDAANLTAVTVLATGVCQVIYIGVAPYSSASVDLLVNVTTAAITITWAEVAVYKGTPVLNAACPDLTRLGYLDVAGSWNSIGRKKNTIALTTATQPGDNIYIILGAAATTMPQIRGALADDLQTGLFQTLTARPSLTPGPVAGTLGGATAVPGWLAVKFN